MATEDYTTYTETDVVGDHLTVVDANTLTHDTYRNEDVYLYKDFGANHFGDFEHLVNSKITADFNDSAWGYLWGMSDSVDDLFGNVANNVEALGVLFWCVDFTFNDFRVVLWETDGAGNTFTDATGAMFAALNTWYYFKIVKSGTALNCYIYDNVARGAGDLLDTLTIDPLQADYTLRYMYASSSYNSGHNLRLNISQEDLDLQEAAGLSIPVAMNQYGTHINKKIRGG